MVKITKAIAEKRLGDVSEDNRFWCNDGRYLKSLPELIENHVKLLLEYE